MSTPSVTERRSLSHLIQEEIQTGHITAAIQHLLLDIEGVDKKDLIQIKQIYTTLFQLLFQFNEEQKKILTHPDSPFLQKLLDYSPQLYEEQGQLAMQLAALRTTPEGSGLELMYYYATAITIAEKNRLSSAAIHCLASQLFLTIFQDSYCMTFENDLDAAQRKGDVKKFEEHLKFIGRLNQFCLKEDDKKVLKELYIKAENVYNGIRATTKVHFQHMQALISKGLVSPIELAERPITQKYREDLKTFRSHFSEPLSPVRSFQKTIAQKFKAFFAHFVEDAFALIGLPPCNYDIRAMGSIGREEMCPFSDLEMMILIEQEKHAPYFKKLVQMLELQIACLNETAALPLVFTCLHAKNPSGFHLDTGGNPAQNPDLIHTPLEMALLQKAGEIDPNSIQHTALTSQSLHSNDTTLFECYQQELKVALPIDRRQANARELLKKKLEEFKKEWTTSHNPQPNIKKHYVEFLYHLLGHMALYWGLESTNTLEMIEELSHKGVFASNSVELLKESVEILYTLRVRTHLYYGEQKEELVTQALFSSAQEDLEKIHILVLKPLYSRLASVFDHEQDFESVFSQLDLLGVAFSDAFNKASSQSLTAFKRLIIYLASYLVQTGAPVEEHEFYFKQLSKLSELESLRQTYLETLGSSSPQLVQALEMIPNPTGLRRAFVTQSQQLLASLEAMTTPDPPPAHVPSVKVTHPSFGSIRYLKQEAIEQILDKQGNIRAFYKGSAHRVAPLVLGSHQLHFKQKPTHPLMEYAIHNLFFRIAGNLTHSSTLARFDILIGNKKIMYPVLISQTIAGKTLKEALVTSSAFGQEQWERFTWMLICSLLTLPGDGRFSNYVLDPQSNIFCIDNDISFVEPLIKELGMSTVNFCCGLFCLFGETIRLSPKALKQFCSLDSDPLLNGWIEDVIAQEEINLPLFSAEEQDRLYHEDPNNRFKTTILFREGALATLNIQFCHLQDQIKSALERNIDPIPLDLLSSIIRLGNKGTKEQVGPHIYKRYKKALANPNIMKRLQDATARNQECSLSSVQADSACYGKIPSFDEMQQRQLYSPLKAREELFSVLLNHVAEHIHIGKIQKKKIVGGNFAHFIEASRQKFVVDALISQIHHSKEKPTSVILQYCRALNSDTLEPLLHEKLELLDLRFCENIRDKDILKIQQHCPNLTELYLTGCSQIKYFTAGLLTAVPLEFTKLSTLHLDQCESLISIKVIAPLLKSLKAAKNNKLIDLEVSSICLPEKENYKDSPNLVAIKLTTWSLSGAYEWQKNDPDIFTAVVQSNQKEFKYIGNELRNNEDFILKMMQYYGRALAYATQRLKNKKDFILILVAQYGLALEDVSELLQDDKEVVLTAISQNRGAYRYASPRLQNDYEVAAARYRL